MFISQGCSILLQMLHNHFLTGKPYLISSEDFHADCYLFNDIKIVMGCPLDRCWAAGGKIVWSMTFWKIMEMVRMSFLVWRKSLCVYHLGCIGAEMVVRAARRQTGTQPTETLF